MDLITLNEFLTKRYRYNIVKKVIINGFKKTVKVKVEEWVSTYSVHYTEKFNFSDIENEVYNVK